MGILFNCIKWFQKFEKKRESPFSNFNSPNSVYICSKTYLGAKAKVQLCDRQIELHFSFSVKDGVLVQIKGNQPLRILFDYVDGSYYVNDSGNIYYNRLIESLSAIKNDTSIHDHFEMFAKLEEIMYDFIARSFCNSNQF